MKLKSNDIKDLRKDNEKLRFLLANKFSKDELVNFLKKNPNQFINVCNIALTKTQPEAWRATWLLNQIIVNNDKRLKNKTSSILKLIPNCNEGHQREWLRVLEKLKVKEDEESVLFGICIDIWKDILKRPGVRIIAFRILVNIVKKYPDLIDEIKLLTQNHFTETLSPGIKNSFIKLEKELNSNLSVH
jgi:hypothetical protein